MRSEADRYATLSQRTAVHPNWRITQRDGYTDPQSRDAWLAAQAADRNVVARTVAHHNMINDALPRIERLMGEIQGMSRGASGSLRDAFTNRASDPQGPARRLHAELQVLNNQWTHYLSGSQVTESEATRTELPNLAEGPAERVWRWLTDGQPQLGILGMLTARLGVLESEAAIRGLEPMPEVLDQLRARQDAAQAAEQRMQSLVRQEAGEDGWADRVGRMLFPANPTSLPTTADSGDR